MQPSTANSAPRALRTAAAFTPDMPTLTLHTLTLSSLSVGMPVSRASSVSLGLSSEMQGSSSSAIGPSTPPASKNTGTPAALAICAHVKRMVHAVAHAAACIEKRRLRGACASRP